jgi:hypothetical protein
MQHLSECLREKPAFFGMSGFSFSFFVCGRRSYRNAALSPVTHFLSGWALGVAARVQRRDRALITLAGVVPDIDGFGLPFELLARNSNYPLAWWSDYHHVLGHNLGFALLTGSAVCIFAQQRVLTTFWALTAFHVHLFEDLIGARGPDGHQWPIPYLSPFSSRWQFTWTGQWFLNGYPNFILTVVLMAFAVYWAWARGFSPVELISRRADRGLVAILRRRFPRPGAPLLE